MKPNEAQKFSDLLTAVMSYYRQDVSDFTQTLFWDACQSFDFDQVQQAFNRHAKDPQHGQFAPKVADLVRILGGTVTERSALAWGKTFEAMQSVGAYSDVIFDDPAIHAAVEDMGGWQKMCRSELKELSYLQHRFTEAYRAYANRGKFDYPRKLMGDRSPDHVFEAKGLPPPKAAFVGNPAVCALVYEGGTVGGKTAISFGNVASLAMSKIERLAA